MASAAARTFAIPELLEQILFAAVSNRFDDSKDTAALLRARRISQTFNAIIAESPELQRALWFRPPSCEGSEYKRNDFVVGRGKATHRLASGGVLRLDYFARGRKGFLSFRFSDMIGHEVPSGYWSQMYACSTPRSTPLEGPDYRMINWRIEVSFLSGSHRRQERRARLSGMEFVRMTFGQLLGVAREGQLVVRPPKQIRRSSRSMKAVREQNGYLV